ncbi:uncharacterized protein EDB93DRAFT_1293186 [Suillus bovinus]|uniref:uncharacterized protein n=1 Tax=Suillus bovinus TaxID=48563 RepID=UPI001B86EF11|nr:uncharacterized protein EDB93DRAFT_1293186 [Suillus bovinus]KAG2142247.1 hypothetical protein EDB93DRAFT_1293186 [Suillus bovinus]
MSTQRDLERADPGPSFEISRNATDGQRDEQVHNMTQKDAQTTAGDDSALIAAWMQRLQTLTVITTFLTSIDGELFTLTSSSSQVTVNASLEYRELVYACLTGALIFHVCSSILGYVTSFVLIRYKTVDAASPSNAKADALGKLPDTGLRQEINNGKQLLLKAVPPLYLVQSLLQMPSGVRLQSRTSTSPLDLITRCYYTILVLSGAGFIMALLGIATYAWFGLRRVVGIFSISCIGVSLLSCVWAMVY